MTSSSGTLVYVVKTAAGERVGEMAPDGSGAHLLDLGGPVCCYAPDLSPDGTRLVLAGEGTVEVADGDGAHPRGIWSSPTASVSSPVWSPSGRQVAFAATDTGVAPGAPRSIIYEIDADGRGLREIAEATNVRAIAWSPDGTELGFLQNQGGIWAVAADGGPVRAVYGPGQGEPSNLLPGALSWAPSTTMLFDQGPVFGISRFTPGQASATRLLTGASDPSWAPDGTRYAALRDGRVIVTSAGSGSSTAIGPSSVQSVSWGGPATAPAAVSCVGQLVSSHMQSYDKWNFQYGISACEGLVISGVALGGRVMAERMSVPYLNLSTCTGTDLTTCTSPTTRHVTLRPDADEPQTDPAAYTHVSLASSGVSVAQPRSSLCQMDADKQVCDHVVVAATYRVDLAAPSAGPAQPYLLINERFEFYHDFAEQGNKDVACEPSQNAQYGVAIIGTPLPDCGRFKPIVSYSFHAGTSSILLQHIDVAERLHFTPDSAAVQASNFLRDCDPGAPHDNCGPPILQKLETYPNGGAPMPTETVVRAIDGAVSGAGADGFGRFDNLHQTDSSSVEPPGAQGAGCPECVHMHWRWGSDIGAPAAFGNGLPLVGDGEPGAVPNPASRQVLDVGVVAYHSDELAPSDFWSIVQGANQQDLALSYDANHFSGGMTTGTEPLNYPPTSCYQPQDPGTWGQCGEVTWLLASATAGYTHDEDTDTFFAFGGFFCATCTGPLPGQLAAHYTGPRFGSAPQAGQPLTITINTGPEQTAFELFDALPAGTTSVTGQVSYTPIQPTPNQTSTPCIVSVDQAGDPLTDCHIEPPEGNTNTRITITGVLAATATGQVSNVIHATWTTGNYKTTDTITLG